MKAVIKKRIAAISRGETPEGYTRTKAGVAPEEWKTGVLHDIIHLDQRPVPKPDKPYWRLGILSHAKGTFHQFVENPDAVQMDELYQVKKDDLIVNITFAWEHAIALANMNDEGKLVSHRFPTYVFNKAAVPEYYRAVVMQKSFRELLVNISPGGAGRNRVMNKSAFLRLPCFIPPYQEQQKIAKILDACDKVISLKEKLLEEKRKRKKWLLENLLDPYSGIRLPGFTGEWEEANLLSCSIETGKYGINAPACTYKTGLPKYIRITDIDDSGNFLSDNESYVDSPKSCNYYLHENDILFVRTGGTVGKSYLYNKKDGQLVYAGFLIKFSINSKKCISMFIKEVFNTKRYWNWVNTMSARSGQPGINAEEYSGYSFCLPGLIEQKAIANILFSADNEIDSLSKELDEWRSTKKALMQVLLTGTVRVGK